MSTAPVAVPFPTAMPAVSETATQTHESALDKLKDFGTKFVSFMKTVATNTLIALGIIKKYLPTASIIAMAVFPEYASLMQPAQMLVSAAIDTVMNAIIMIQQKTGDTTGNDEGNASKLADVILITKNAVEALLHQAGLTFDDMRLTNIINAIVGLFKGYPTPHELLATAS